MLTATECLVRGIMPQVDNEDIPALLGFLRENGVSVTSGCLAPRELRGRQKVIRSKVHAMPLEATEKPVLVSSDHLVIDGNHRWMKSVVSRLECMKVFQIGLPFTEALKAIFKFPKTYAYADGRYHPIKD